MNFVNAQWNDKILYSSREVHLSGKGLIDDLFIPNHA